MRVVHLVIDGEVGGGQTVALRLAHASRTRGDDVSFVSPSAGDFVDRARSEGFEVDVVPLGGATDVPSAVRLARALRRRRADVLHTHVHFSLNVLGRVAGRLAAARVVAHMHAENVFRPGRAGPVQQLLDDATARLCHAIVAVSDATRVRLLDQGYPRSRVVTIHNGVSPAGPVEPRRLTDGPTVIEVGRLDAAKGQAELIRALALLEPNVSLLLVGRDPGTGAYERSLRRTAEELGVAGRVVFAGFRDDVPALLAGSDVLCLPSAIEGLPLVVLEAMAQGKPVVATAVGGTPELVVDGETGLLVAPGDADALARALREVLADPERARSLGERGRRRVEEAFRADDLVARVLSLYGDRP